MNRTKAIRELFATLDDLESFACRENVKYARYRIKEKKGGGESWYRSRTYDTAVEAAYATVGQYTKPVNHRDVREFYDGQRYLERGASSVCLMEEEDAAHIRNMIALIAKEGN